MGGTTEQPRIQWTSGRLQTLMKIFDEAFTFLLVNQKRNKDTEKQHEALLSRQHAKMLVI